MIEKRTIARPYAQAAFEQALEENDLQGWSEALSALATIASDERMKSLINDPRVSTDQLKKLALDIAGGSLSKTQKNFACILIDSDRFSLSPEISQLFEEKKSEAEKHANVQVITAYEIDENIKEKITKAMERKLGRSVDVTIEQDPGLIGGAIVKAGDMVVDLSVRGRLNQMANEFN